MSKVYANKTFALFNNIRANFTWISEKSQEAQEEGPPGGGKDPRDNVDFYLLFKLCTLNFFKENM
jgi:hypothetical protein